MRRIWAATLTLLTGTCWAAPAADPFYLKQGDTVVFYGDSITDQRLYTMITELFVTTRYPKLDVKFVHSGWGGDRVSGGGGGPIEIRLHRDVLAYKPTVMTIMLGMNDGHYTSHTSADDDAFFNGFRHIVDTMKEAAPGLRITAIEPSPFDDVTRPAGLPAPDGYNAVLVNYGKWIRKLGSEAHLTVADLNGGVVKMLAQAKMNDAETAQKIIPDRVHPSLSGHMIMAEQLLTAWKARPTVAAVSLDAATGKVATKQFAQVSDVKHSNGVSWNELDEALPLPFADLLAGDRDHTIGLAIHSSDITERLNREPLSVSGLASGQYALRIDGQAIGNFSDAQLRDGINLATLETPMSKQAMDVHDLLVKRLDIHQFRWRNLQVPLKDSGSSHLQESLTALDGVEADVAASVRAAAQPKSHFFEIVPTT